VNQYSTQYCIHDTLTAKNASNKKNISSVYMGMEDFLALWVRGFCGDSHRFFCGYGIGMGIEWGLKFNPHGSPATTTTTTTTTTTSLPAAQPTASKHCRQMMEFGYVVFTVRRHASMVYAIVVCRSVCHSLVLLKHLNARRLPRNSSFLTPNISAKLKQGTPNGGAKCRWVRLKLANNLQ